jgi:hypothetical protein
VGRDDPQHRQRRSRRAVRERHPIFAGVAPARGAATRYRLWGVGAERGRVFVGTWNLENLFKPPRKFSRKTAAGYDVKLDALATVITRIDPHVPAVQESSLALIEGHGILAGIDAAHEAVVRGLTPG